MDAAARLKDDYTLPRPPAVRKVALVTLLRASVGGLFGKDRRAEELADAVLNVLCGEEKAANDVPTEAPPTPAVAAAAEVGA